MLTGLLVTYLVLAQHTGHGPYNYRKSLASARRTILSMNQNLTFISYIIGSASLRPAL